MEHGLHLRVTLAPEAAELRAAGAQPPGSLLPGSSGLPSLPSRATYAVQAASPTHMEAPGLAGLG